MERSLSYTEEKNWSRESKIKFIAPKGKNYRVRQVTCFFKSPLADDNCDLMCDYIVEETDGNFPNWSYKPKHLSNMNFEKKL